MNFPTLAELGPIPEHPESGFILALRFVIETGRRNLDEFIVLANRTDNLKGLLRQAEYDTAEFLRLFIQGMRSIKPTDCYAVAGYPYGKSVRGWKKWRKANA